MPIPPQHNQLMPYLILPIAPLFIEFMKDIFGATEQIMVPRSEGGIMHGELRIGDSVIMFADTTAEFTSRPAGIFIYVDDVDSIYQKAMDKGAHSKMKPVMQSYGYTCGFQDPFGNDWWPLKFRHDKAFTGNFNSFLSG